MIELAAVAVPPLDIDVRVIPAPEVTDLSLDRAPTTIVVLGYTSIDREQADARTMLDVLYLQQRYALAGDAPRLVVEMRDDDRADLAVLTGPDDFLISSALGSQLIAQLIDQPERRAVLLELYVGEHASIRMIPCERLGLVGACTMGAIVATAYADGVLAIGWRLSADGTVVLNPEVDTAVTLVAGDELIVVG